MDSLKCHKCNQEWEFEPPLPRAATCDGCGWDARCCLNCQFYDTHAYRECREPQAEYVQNKDRGNFCSYFRAVGSRTQENPDDKVKAKLAELFGGGTESKPAAKGGLSEQLADFLKSKK